MTSKATIQPDSFLTLHYRLSDDQGHVFISTFEGQAATLSMGEGSLPPAIEQRLLGTLEGSHVNWSWPQNEVFGPRNEDLIQRVSHQLLEQLSSADSEYQVGDAVSFPTPNGSGVFAGVVQSISPEGVLFDFNHPLAGRSVHFEANILAVL